MDGNNSLVFQELIKKQRTNCKEARKLTLHDIKRISKNIKTSIFDDTNCSLWGGYVTNKNNINKTKYINFYFRHRKVALHRLLYENYVLEIDESQYIKYNCPNKGFCCNVNHMFILDTDKKEPKQEEQKEEQKQEKTENKKKDIIVNFN